MCCKTLQLYIAPHSILDVLLKHFLVLVEIFFVYDGGWILQEDWQVLSSFWGPKKLDESHSSMIGQLFPMLYLHFNKHLHNIESQGFRKESTEAKGDSTQIPFMLCVL